jgi:hypothetical protein
MVAELREDNGELAKRMREAHKMIDEPHRAARLAPEHSQPVLPLRALPTRETVTISRRRAPPAQAASYEFA